MIPSILLLLAAFANVSKVAANSGLHVGPFESGQWILDTTEESRDPRAFHVQQHHDLPTKFIVALKHRTVDLLKQELLNVSMPRSPTYGKHLSIAEIRSKYAPLQKDIDKVIDYFSAIPGVIVTLNKVGSMLHVEAPLHAIENHLDTKLAWFRHFEESTPKRSLRATKSLRIPLEVQNVIAFISLNSPVSHNVKPKRVKSKVGTKFSDIFDEKADSEIPRKLSQQKLNNFAMESGNREKATQFDSKSFGSKELPSRVYVTEGNREVLIRFYPRCEDGTLNQMSTPCGERNDVLKGQKKLRTFERSEEESRERGRGADVAENAESGISRKNEIRVEEKENVEEEEEQQERVLEGEYPSNDDFRKYQRLPSYAPTHTSSPSSFPTATPKIVPTFIATVTEHASDKNDPYLLATEPLTFILNPKDVFCYNSWTEMLCNGNEGRNCSCLAKLSPLPKYTQLRVTVTSYSHGISSASTTMDQGHSSLFVLTDVATVSMLSELYNMPTGLTVRHGSTQSVAEFYGQYYSNSDLATFLALTGLKIDYLPADHVFGDNGNNEKVPGGEGQLDIEYLLALAPGAETFYYSFSDLNPYDSANEGFLNYLFFVGNQTAPALVHSLSYGDVEQSVFNISNKGSTEYGNRCDEEFIVMGLRGLTVLVASGDDGIANSIIRKNKKLGCSKSWPDWPASSAFVTAVGATQLSNVYAPACTASYDVSRTLPDELKLNFQCTGTGEIVCSSTQGGVVTSGGGFSNSNNRDRDAPWQKDAVSAYLQQTQTPDSPLIAKTVAFPPAHTFNAQGRGYPDISTYGSNYFVFLDGEVTRESGTSASSPVFGAMVTLWNDMRLAYNMPPLGFIAPFLYHVYEFSPEAFNDVVLGDNACGVGGSIETANCCDYGFSAVPGWDAVTGLGSPNFQIIANLVANNGSFFPNSNDNQKGAYKNEISQGKVSPLPTTSPTQTTTQKPIGDRSDFKTPATSHPSPASKSMPDPAIAIAAAAAVAEKREILSVHLATAALTVALLALLLACVAIYFALKGTLFGTPGQRLLRPTNRGYESVNN